MDYLDGPGLITWVLTVEGHLWLEGSVTVTMKKGSERWSPAGFDDGGGARAQECGKLPETGKVKERV